MWLSTGPSATGSGGVPAPIEPRMKKLASILLGTLFAACALHAGEAVASELSPSVVEKALADPVGNWGQWGKLGSGKLGSVCISFQKITTSLLAGNSDRPET